MTTYVKASDSIINVVDTNGKEHKVTQRAYDIVYKAKGYKLADGSPSNEKQDEGNGEPVNYFDSTREELEKVKNDDLKAFLTEEKIDVEPGAIKKDLIDLILGE